MDIETQRQYFADAVTALGGQQATSRLLNLSDRTLRMLLAGQRRIHAGHLEDIAKALIERADLCRALERKLSPAFAQNLSDAQSKPPLHNGKGSTLLDRLSRELHKARTAGKTPESWLFSHSFYDRLVEEVGHELDGRDIYSLPWVPTKDENLHERGFALECDGE